jgi:hypothetical protein
MQSWNIFRIGEGFLSEFEWSLEIWKFILPGWAHLSAAHASFQLCAPVTMPTLLATDPVTTRGPRSWWRARRRRSPPVAIAPHARVALSSVEGGGGSLPFPFLLPCCFCLSPPFYRTYARRLARRWAPHHPSQGTSPPTSVEGVATPFFLSHRPWRWVGLHPWLLLPPWVGCHWPPSFDLLWAKWPHRKLPHYSPVLPDPRFYSGSHWSEPSLSTTTPLTAMPLTSHTSEPPFCQPCPIDSLWDKLPPRLLLLCHLVAGWPKSTDGAALVKKGTDPVFWSTGPKGSGGPDRFNWLGWVHCGLSLVA